MRQHNQPSAHVAIADYVMEKIASNEIRPGEKVPSLNQLCDRFKVNKGVVRRALARLESLGWVEPIIGKGSFVKRRIITVPYTLSEKTRFTDNMQVKTTGHRRKLLHWERGQPTQAEREMLELEANDEVYRLEVLRFVDEEFFLVTSNVLVEKHYPHLEHYLDKYQSLSDIAVTHYGFQPIRIRTTIRTLFPSGSDLQYFAENSPILRTTSLSIHPSGYPVGVSYSRMRGDMGEISIEFAEKRQSSPVIRTE